MIGPLPPLTIGIPFYNAESFLMDAIKSVFAQTHEDWELILVDDGSSDRSLEIARSVCDPRVRVYSDGVNKKLAARLNEINQRAKYEFVARMDADDLMACDRIEKQLAFLLDKPEIDLVSTGVCSITDYSSPYGIRVPGENHALGPFAVLSGRHGITHASLVGRKEWFLRNPYDPSDGWAEDFKLWVRACRRDDLAVGFIGEPLYFYRELGSMTPKKMLHAQSIVRGVVLANGISMVGGLRTLALVGQSLLKTVVIGGAALVGATDSIVKLRSPTKDDGAFQMVRDHVECIASVSVHTTSGATSTPTA